jgi:hypothetical protein
MRKRSELLEKTDDPKLLDEAFSQTVRQQQISREERNEQLARRRRGESVELRGPRAHPDVPPERVRQLLDEMERVDAFGSCDPNSPPIFVNPKGQAKFINAGASADREPGSAAR